MSTGSMLGTSMFVVFWCELWYDLSKAISNKTSTWSIGDLKKWGFGWGECYDH